MDLQGTPAGPRAPLAGTGWVNESTIQVDGSVLPATDFQAGFEPIQLGTTQLGPTLVDPSRPNSPKLGPNSVNPSHPKPGLTETIGSERGK